MSPRSDQCSLFDLPLDHTAKESASIRTQMLRVVQVMSVGHWTTLAGLAQNLRRLYPGQRFPECSLSARLRDMRRSGWVVERRHVRNGLYEYRALRQPIGSEEDARD